MAAENDLQEIERRLSLITATPWRFDFLDGKSPFPSSDLEGIYASVVSANDRRIATVWEYEPYETETDDIRNGEFIADAPSIIANLIAEIRHLRSTKDPSASGG